MNDRERDEWVDGLVQGARRGTSPEHSRAPYSGGFEWWLLSIFTVLPASFYAAVKLDQEWIGLVGFGTPFLLYQLQKRMFPRT